MKGFQSINKRLSVRFFIWALLSHLLVHQLIDLPVGLLLLVVSMHCQSARLVCYITAPAHLHATKVTLYPALFIDT